MSSIRVIESPSGGHWTVWATVPSVQGAVSDQYRDGWLTFESGETRKRLAPIPRDWRAMSDAELYALLVDKAADARAFTPHRSTRPVE